MNWDAQWQNQYMTQAVWPWGRYFQSLHYGIQPIMACQYVEINEERRKKKNKWQKDDIYRCSSQKSKEIESA